MLFLEETAASTSMTITVTSTGVFFTTGKAKTLVQLTLAAGPSTTAGDVEVALFYTCEEPQI